MPTNDRRDLIRRLKVKIQKFYMVLTLYLLMCIVFISEQTATFALYSTERVVFYKRGGECLLRGTD